LETLRHHVDLGFLLSAFVVISSSINVDFMGDRGKHLILAQVRRAIAVLEDHDLLAALS
jgi:hypothetical protein